MILILDLRIRILESGGKRNFEIKLFTADNRTSADILMILD